MKAKDLIPYQTPESLLISSRSFGKTDEFIHTEYPVVSIEWIVKMIGGKPTLHANIEVKFSHVRIFKDTIRFFLENGVFTQNKYSVPQAFRFIDYSEMTPEEIEDSKHPTGILSTYWAKKAYHHRKAEEAHRNLLKYEKLKTLEDQVKAVLSQFHSQSIYSEEAAASDIVAIFGSVGIAKMVEQLNNQSALPEYQMDKIIEQLKTIGVFYDEKLQDRWQYLPDREPEQTDE